MACLQGYVRACLHACVRVQEVGHAGGAGVEAALEWLFCAGEGPRHGTYHPPGAGWGQEQGREGRERERLMAAAVARSGGVPKPQRVGIEVRGKT
jgi:hypothetical protein